MMRWLFWLGLASVGCLLASSVASAEPRSAIAMHGEPRLAGGFSHFPYVNPDAPKGGMITLAAPGSFDSLNPLIIKGSPVSGVRELQIESLMARGQDEAFTLYGLLAETIDVSDDRTVVTFNLNPKAQFSSRTPVTPEDVLYSFELLKTKGRPNHRTYFAKVRVAEKTGERSVRFTLQDANDRELPLILALMPVFAKHGTSEADFEKSSLTPLTGSGPYKIGSVDAGRSITYVRDPGYWGRDLAINRGRFNFDSVRFLYFRDASVQIEAFKQGLVDYRIEEDPGRWATGYNFPAVRDGKILKREFETGIPWGMTGLVFNTRRDVFKDAAVRRALITLFDFEWINRSLYSGLFKRNTSYFERSYLSSSGRRADARERDLLKDFPDAVRPEILDGTFRLPETNGSGQNRDNQKRALELLKAAGYELKSGRLVKAATGEQVSIEILASNTAQESLLLSTARCFEPLGIATRVRTVDSAQYQERLNNFDFDMIQYTWGATLSPGNEQLFRWSTAAADAKGSYNFPGVKSPAAEAMIKAMLASATEADFVSAVRALDRVLLSGDYVIPLFFVPKEWIAHWARLKAPEKTPVFGYGYVPETWWIEEPRP